VTLGAASVADVCKLAPLPEPGNTPAITISPQLDEMVDQAIEALARRGGIFQRGGALVEVVSEPAPPSTLSRPAGAPRIAEVDEARAMDLLSGAACWTDGKGKQKLPPKPAVRAVLSRPERPGIPPLSGIVEAPILRADGSVLAAPGYDAATGLYLADSVRLDLPSAPTRDDARRAGAELLEVVEEFPFAGDTDRAAWLAMVLTPLARHAIDGPAPCFILDKNVRGCGGSLGADTVGIIVCGRDLTRVAPPETDVEVQKTITAVALAAEPIVLLDNVARPFGWASLDAALTGTSWNSRVLGHSRMTGRVPLATTWIATGNNIVIAGDTVRRVLRIRLESREERPEERRGFRHPDLRAYVRDERGRLLSAAFTLLRAYYLAGRPAQGLPPWGSYEAWSDTVRSAIAWAGLGDPAAGRADYASQVDEEHAILSALLDGLELLDPSGRGLSVNEMRRRTGDTASLDELPAMTGLREALAELAGESWSARRVGKGLARFSRRVAGGRYLERMPGTVHGLARWRVARLTEAAR
jgi:hypothetical protein